MPRARGGSRDLPGFGAKTEAAILQGVEAHLTKKQRFKLTVAAQYAEPLAEYLRKSKGAGEVVICGSYRRMKETVGDIDILITSDTPDAVMAQFAKYPEHPSGRLIEAREPYEVDMLKIVRKAKARGIALELNSHPDRLDLSDTHCRMAKEEGVLVAISSDAHTTLDLENLRFGVGQARRGWLEKTDVLNTRPLTELRRIIGQGHSGETRPASPRRAARVKKRVTS